MNPVTHIFSDDWSTSNSATLAAGHDRACSRMTEEAKFHPWLYVLRTHVCWIMKLCTPSTDLSFKCFFQYFMFFRLFSGLTDHSVCGLYWIYCGISHKFEWDTAQLFVGSEASPDGKCVNKLWEMHQVKNLFIHMLISRGSGVAIFPTDANMGNYFLPTKALNEHYLAEKFQKKGKYQAI